MDNIFSGSKPGPLW